MLKIKILVTFFLLGCVPLQASSGQHSDSYAIPADWSFWDSIRKVPSRLSLAARRKCQEGLLACADIIQSRMEIVRESAHGQMIVFCDRSASPFLNAVRALTSFEEDMSEVARAVPSYVEEVGDLVRGVTHQTIDAWGDLLVNASHQDDFRGWSYVEEGGDLVRGVTNQTIDAWGDLLVNASHQDDFRGWIFGAWGSDLTQETVDAFRDVQDRAHHLATQFRTGFATYWTLEALVNDLRMLMVQARHNFHENILFATSIVQSGTLGNSSLVRELNDDFRQLGSDVNSLVQGNLLALSETATLQNAFHRASTHLSDWGVKMGNASHRGMDYCLEKFGEVGVAIGGGLADFVHECRLTILNNQPLQQAWFKWCRAAVFVISERWDRRHRPPDETVI